MLSRFLSALSVLILSVVIVMPTVVMADDVTVIEIPVYNKRPFQCWATMCLHSQEEKQAAMSTATSNMRNFCKGDTNADICRGEMESAAALQTCYTAVCSRPVYCRKQIDNQCIQPFFR